VFFSEVAIMLFQDTAFRGLCGCRICGPGYGGTSLTKKKSAAPFLRVRRDGVCGDQGVVLDFGYGEAWSYGVAAETWPMSDCGVLEGRLKGGCAVDGFRSAKGIELFAGLSSVELKLKAMPATLSRMRYGVGRLQRSRADARARNFGIGLFGLFPFGMHGDESWSDQHGNEYGGNEQVMQHGRCS
jgi:hypothetical protein